MALVGVKLTDDELALVCEPPVSLRRGAVSVPTIGLHRPPQGLLFFTGRRRHMKPDQEFGSKHHIKPEWRLVGRVAVVVDDDFGARFDVDQGCVLKIAAVEIFFIDGIWRKAVVV